LLKITAIAYPITTTVNAMTRRVGVFFDLGRKTYKRISINSVHINKRFASLL
jgi:hypothetical protein